MQLRSVHNAELSAICQQLLTLQSSMAKEKARLQSILDEKDERISSQRSELDRLNLLITDHKRQRESSNKVESTTAKVAAQGHQHRQPKVASSGAALDRHRPAGSSTAAAAAASLGSSRVPGSSFRHGYIQGQGGVKLFLMAKVPGGLF